MNIYKLMGVIAIAAVLGTACKKEVNKPTEAKEEVKKVNDLYPKHPCGTWWIDLQGNGHYAPC